MIPAFLLLIWAYLSLVSTIHIFLANTLFYEYLNIFLLTGLSFFVMTVRTNRNKILTDIFIYLLKQDTFLFLIRLKKNIDQIIF